MHSEGKNRAGGEQVRCFKIIALAALLAGCAGIGEIDPRQAAGGALAGAALTKAVEKTKEVFSPHYPLIASPIQVCDVVSNSLFVKCFLIPCAKEGQCSIKYGKEQFFKDNSKMITVSQSLFVPVKKFCKMQPEACLEQSGYYAGKKIVILKDEK